MLEHECTTLAGLRQWFDSMPSDIIFRGQRRHFGEDGKTGLTSSFSRTNCATPLMFKWIHYTKDLLRGMSNSKYEDVNDEFSQALLQHYGWRSFYIDVTSNFSVAAWFASHTFNMKPFISAVEDCHEHCIQLTHQNASYSLGNELGHIYGFCRSTLEENGIGVVDLSILKPLDFIPRYSKQHAMLLGPLRETISSSLIHAHLKCPASILAEAAALEGFDRTEDLFPTQDEDAILDTLLRLPWTSANIDGLSIFKRGLPLPEYDLRPEKILPPHNAFYSPSWIADDRGGDELPFTMATFIRVPEDIFYSQPTPTSQRLEKVTRLLRERRCIAIETDGILRFPEFSDDSVYGKGVFICLVDERTAEISSIFMEHPGTIITSMGITRPWTYRLSGDGIWVRIAGSQDCPCNNPQIHFHNFWVVGSVEYLLSTGQLVEYNALDFRLE